MTNHSRHFIGVIFTELDLYNFSVTFETKLGDIGFGDPTLRFNHIQTSLRGVRRPLDRDAIEIFVSNPELPEVLPGNLAPVYWVVEAEREFPYLFHDTNPLLYRKF